MQELLDFAQKIADLSGPAMLALVLILAIRGVLRFRREIDEKDTQIQYREQLLNEAVEDRKASDARVDALTTTLRATNDLTERSIDLLENTIDELVRPSKG